MANRKKRYRGFTLLELLIYTALLGFVLTGICGIFISSIQLFRITEIRTGLQQNALKATSNIFTDLAGSKDSTIYIENSPMNGIIFASSLKSDGTYEFDSSNGKIKWQKWICYYLQPVGNEKYELIKKEIPIQTPTTDPGTCPYSTITQFAQANVQDMSSQVIARDVQILSISKSGTSGNYSFQIKFDNTTDTTRPNRLEVTSEIHVRN
jgi:type II secretory pathway pseudopilin PulG